MNTHAISLRTLEVDIIYEWADVGYRLRCEHPVSYTHLDVYKRQLLLITS